MRGAGGVGGGGVPRTFLRLSFPVPAAQPSPQPCPTTLPHHPPAAGRRNFSDFLSQYLPPVPGTFVSVDSGRPLGPCPNLLTVTHGQRPGIGGAADRMYVVGKDVVSLLGCRGSGFSFKISVGRGVCHGKRTGCM